MLTCTLAILAGGVHLHCKSDKTDAAAGQSETSAKPGSPLSSVPGEEPAKVGVRENPELFEPNPALEKHLQKKSAGLVLEAPRQGNRMYISGRAATLAISGKANAGTAPIRAEIFNNDTSGDSRPVWAGNVSITPAGTDGKTSFYAKASLAATEGLYYLLLKNADSGAVLHGASFQVIVAK